MKISFSIFNNQKNFYQDFKLIIKRITFQKLKYYKISNYL